MALISFHVGDASDLCVRLSDRYGLLLLSFILDCAAENVSPSGSMEPAFLLERIALARRLSLAQIHARGFQMEQLKSYLADLERLIPAAQESLRPIVWS